MPQFLENTILAIKEWVLDLFVNVNTILIDTSNNIANLSTNLVDLSTNLVDLSTNLVNTIEDDEEVIASHIVELYRNIDTLAVDTSILINDVSYNINNISTRLSDVSINLTNIILVDEEAVATHIMDLHEDIRILTLDTSALIEDISNRIKDISGGTDSSLREQLIDDEYVIATQFAKIDDDIDNISTAIIQNELVIANHIISLHTDVSTIYEKLENIDISIDIPAIEDISVRLADVSTRLNNTNLAIDNVSNNLTDTSININQHIDSSFILVYDNINILDIKCDDTQTIVQSAVAQLISSGSVTLNLPLVDLTNTPLSYDTSIEPNKMYMFGEKTELTINHLITGLPGIVNEYMFLFTSSSIGDCSLNVPNTVKWLDEPDILNNKIYMISIENNLGLIGEWDNE